MARICGNENAIRSPEKPLASQRCDAKYKRVEQYSRIVIGVRRVPEKREGGQRDQQNRDASLRGNQRSENGRKIRSDAKQCIQHKEAWKRHQERKKQKQRHFKGRIEHLQQSIPT